MAEFSDADRKRITEALTRVGAMRACPRCGHGAFTLIDGYFNQPIQTDLGSMVFGGPSIPSVVVACTRCGFMSQHALGVLGLLPPPPPPPSPSPRSR